jgi:hypothetical protein
MRRGTLCTRRSAHSGMPFCCDTHLCDWVLFPHQRTVLSYSKGFIAFVRRMTAVINKISNHTNDSLLNKEYGFCCCGCTTLQHPARANGYISSFCGTAIAGPARPCMQHGHLLQQQDGSAAVVAAVHWSVYCAC